MPRELWSRVREGLAERGALVCAVPIGARGGARSAGSHAPPVTESPQQRDKRDLALQVTVPVKAPVVCLAYQLGIEINGGRAPQIG